MRRTLKLMQCRQAERDVEREGESGADLAGKGEKKANNKITFVYHRVGVGIKLDYDVDVDEQSRAA